MGTIITHGATSVGAAGSGGLELSTVTPPGLPPGVDVWFQEWIADGAAPVGFSATNGLRVTTP